MDELRLEARPLVRVESRSGRVDVTFEDRADVLVETHNPRRDVEEGPGYLTFKASNRIKLRLPLGTNMNIGSLSGRVELRGRAGDVRIAAASGSVSVEEAARADIRTISGGIQVGQCGDCRASTKSGRIEVDSARRADLAAVSGRIRLGHAEREVRVKTVSGRVELGAAGRHDVTVHTISGSILLRLPKGTKPDLRAKNLFGRATNAFLDGDDCRVSISTLSGKVELAET